MTKSLICMLVFAFGFVFTSCQKESDIAVESVVLDQSTLTLIVGSTDVLSATILPMDATNNAISWSSSAPEIVSVGASGIGRITAVAVGSATITVTTDDGGKTATCYVTVSPPIALGITLDRTTLSLTVGDTESLTATVHPENAEDKTIIWISSDDEIVTVDNGMVTAVAVGSATITAKTVDGDKTATCSVTVTPIIAVDGITIDNTTADLNLNETIQLTATITPDDAADQTVIWETDNPAVATVVDGLVKAISAGSAIITATTADGNFKANCVVTVIPSTVLATWEIGSPIASDIIATLYSHGLLSISGTGAMQDGIIAWGSAKDNITSVVINSGVTTIGHNNFMDVASLTSVVIPNSVISIGSAAFWGSSSLTSVFFGSNVTSIGYAAFYRCNLTEVHIENPNPPIIDGSFWGVNQNCKLYVPSGTQSKYAAARGWRGIFDIVGFVPIEFVQESKYMNLEIYEHQLPITTEQLSEWLSNLDRMYEQFVYLMNGLKPFNGRKMTIRSVDGISAWAYAGNPIQWNSAYIADQLEAFVTDGDWSFGIMHEMGHNFGGQIGGFGNRNTSYNFSEEIFANFRMYLALTRVNDATVNMNDVIYKGAGIADYYKLDYDYKMENNEPLNSDGAMYTLIRLGNHYQKDGDHGFWLYKEAFAIINRLPSNSAVEDRWSDWQRFNRFLEILSSCVGRDVRETYSAKELELIESAYK